MDCSENDCEGSWTGASVKAYKYSAIRRIVSAFDLLLSGESFWERYTRSVDEKSGLRDKSVRLDVALGDREPRLDDVAALPELKYKVRNDPSLSAAIGSMSDRIIASMFYFELRNMPTQDGAAFQGAGHILCRRKSGDAALPLLIDKLLSWNAKFIVNDKVLGGSMLSPSFWDRMGNFMMPADFQAFGQELHVSLQWPDGRVYPISGSRYLINQLVAAQGLNAPFGLPDHRRWHRAPGRADAGRQRATSEIQAKPLLKRRRTAIDVAQSSLKKARLWL